MTTQISCSKCEKTFTTKRRLQEHEEKCSGLSSLQCEFCHKTFKNKKSKYNHKKNKVCEKNGTMIDNSTNVETHINSHNNSHNNININATINIHITLNFGEEKYKLNPELAKECLTKEGMDGILELIKDRFFNEIQNRTIKKEIKKDGFIKIHKNNEWITKDKDPVIDKILEHVLPPVHEFWTNETSDPIEFQKSKMKFLNFLQKSEVLNHFYLIEDDGTKFKLNELLWDFQKESKRNQGKYRKIISDFLHQQTKNYNLGNKTVKSTSL